METTTTPATRTEPVFRQIASAIDARQNLSRNIESVLAHHARPSTGRPQTEDTIDGPDANNLRAWREWYGRHADRIRALVSKYLPRGSGFDSGTTIDMDRSRPDFLVFCTSFHHMDENGFYDGWTEHTVTVRACMIHGIRMHITGPNRNDILDYIGESFQHALTSAQPVE